MSESLEEIVNYYEILEISRDAEANEIEEKYRNITRRLRPQQNHPDDNIQEEAKRKLKELPKAKKILLDSVERQKYNRKLEEYERRNQKNSFGGTQDKNTTTSSSELIKEAYRLFASGSIRQALELAKKATAIYGEDPDTWALLAEARFRTNDIESSIYEYKRAIDLRPREAKYHHSLGEVYEAAKRDNDALREYRNAVECDTKSLFYRLSLGIFHARIKDWNASIKILEDCFKTAPNQPEVSASLALVYNGWVQECGSYKSKDDIKTALQILDKAEGLSANSSSENITTIQRTKILYCSYLQRKFNGNYLLGVVSSFLWSFTFGKLFYIGLILFAGLYYLSSRPPRYTVITQETFAQKSMRSGLGRTTFALVFPILIPLNFIKNYTGENRPSSDEYLRSVILSMRNKAKGIRATAP